MGDRTAKSPVIVALVLGIGLVAAPFMFQMFTRAPMGAEMIDGFRPYMTSEQVTLFQGHLATIEAANTEAIVLLRPSIISSGYTDGPGYDAQFSSAVGLSDAWPAINDDMGDLLVRMENNISNYEAVDALPSFDLFPWFFVLPGLIIAGLAGWTLVTIRRSGAASRRQLLAIIAMGLAVVAAPAIFQMFTRAPKGGDMINDFRPIMTRDRVLAVQSYFITIGGAEGQYRVAMLPLDAEIRGVPESQLAGDYPALTELSQTWPVILTDFAPMISTMSDNVENFAAVDALPPFPLFPWFFVVPGLLVAGAGIVALRDTNSRR
ncbi:MAG: hypothetical protein ACC652_04325 [Acidimicrobiales bacterium]